MRGEERPVFMLAVTTNRGLYGRNTFTSDFDRNTILRFYTKKELRKRLFELFGVETVVFDDDTICITKEFETDGITRKLKEGAKLYNLFNVDQNFLGACMLRGAGKIVTRRRFIDPNASDVTAEDIANFIKFDSTRHLVKDPLTGEWDLSEPWILNTETGEIKAQDMDSVPAGWVYYSTDSILWDPESDEPDAWGKYQEVRDAWNKAHSEVPQAKTQPTPENIDDEKDIDPYNEAKKPVVEASVNA